MTLLKPFCDFTLNTSNVHEIFDKEMNVSKHIPMEYFVTPEIFSTRNGELGAVIKVHGTSFDVKDADELNHLQFLLGFMLKSLGDEYALYVTHHRELQKNVLEGNYPAGFSQDFYSDYSKQFSSAELFGNDIYLTLIQKSGNKHVKKGYALLDSFSRKKSELNFNEHHALRLQKFQMALTNLLSSLAPYQPSLLGEKEDSSQALSFFSLLINARKGNYIYPKSSIASILPEKRLFFGKNTIHFEGLHEHDNSYAAILSIKHYASISKPGMLNALLSTPFEYVSTHSFVSLEKGQALKLINTQIKRLWSTGDAAQSQIYDLQTALDDLASDHISYGIHHNTMMILSKDIKSLEEKVATVVKLYQDQQLIVIRETINLENAFWAQLPGNFKYNRRQALISSHNFSCFCSLHNYYSGYINANHLGSALMLIETASKTPFYFNLHERASGNKNDLPKGHTLLIGPSNAGKTVIMTTIASMYRKHGIRSIFFDRNRGCEIFIRANHGIYNRLLPGEATHWNPCQLKDIPKNRQFLREFIKVLSSSASNVLSASDCQQIAEVVERNFTLPFEKRNLSNIASFFSLNFSGLEAFSRYVNLPDRTGKSGDRAYLFDNEVDRLNFNSDLFGFDMTHWLNDTGQPPEELLPISMYLFHRMEEYFDGRLTGLFLDEGWQWLQQPYWREKLQEYLVTLRKANVFIFLATQLPDKIAESSLSSGLIQGSATILYLANPKALEKDYIHHFKCTPREYELIKNFDPQLRYFLIKQSNESAVGRINLQGLSKYLDVLSSNTSSVAYCDLLRDEMGDDPTKWLPSFYQGIVQ